MAKPPCEHKNLELLYTSLVDDGIDMVMKCKYCGQHIFIKGGYLVDCKINFDSDTIACEKIELPEEGD